MKKLLLMILLVFLAIYLVLTNYFPNVEINRYDSFETVKEKQAMEKGWIPKILPLSAYDIVETHDIDSNTVFGKFSYKESDEMKFLSHLKESNETYVGDVFLFKIDKNKNRVDFRNKVL